MPDANAPNINEYGISHDDWDDMSQDQQADVAHSHGDDWHGEPPPVQNDKDDASPSGTQTGNPSAPPTFKFDAAREQWLADQRERLYDQQEKGYQENINRGRQDWEQQNRDKADRLRGEGRHNAAKNLEKQIDSQRQQWDQTDEESQKGRDQRRSDYIDRPSRESLIKREQDSDTNLERRKMREALANIYRQSSAAEIEEQLWRGWAWEAPPPPPSAARLAAASGPNAVPLFAEGLDPMEKLGWESGAEYLERIEVVQAMRDQLSNERALRESRGEQQFPGESDVDFEERRDAHRQGLSGAPQSALDHALEQLNGMGLDPAECAAALGRLSRDPWFYGAAYDQERRWLSGKAHFYRSVADALDMGRTGTGEDLDAAIEALKELEAQPVMTPGERAYLGGEIDAQEHSSATVKVLANINAFGGEEALGRARGIQSDSGLTPEQRREALAGLQTETWETKVLGSISAFGDPEALGRAQAIQNDGSLTPDQRWQALAGLASETWESKVLGSISAFGDPEALGRAQAIQNDGSLTPDQRWQALAGLASETWESKVLGSISALGDPEALDRAQAVQDDGSLTPEQRQQALADLESGTWESKVPRNISAFGGEEALGRAQAVLNDGSLTREQRWEALADLESETWEAKVLGNIRAFGGEEALTRAQAVQNDGSLTREQRQKALADLESETWEYIKQHNEEAAAKNRDLAESLGWDPHARGGRPELTPLGVHRAAQRKGRARSAGPGGIPGLGPRRQGRTARTYPLGVHRSAQRGNWLGEHPRSWGPRNPGPGSGGPRRREPHAGTTAASAGRPRGQVDRTSHIELSPG